MAIAVSRALEAGAPDSRLRIDREYCGIGGRLRGARRPARGRACEPAAGVAAAKLVQAGAVGLEALEIAAASTMRTRGAQELAEVEEFVLVNSINPDRVEGQKTAAVEVRRATGGLPDVLALPYGGGGNTCAYARGFDESGELPRSSSVRRRSGVTLRERDPHRRARAQSRAEAADPRPLRRPDRLALARRISSGPGARCARGGGRREPRRAAGIAAVIRRPAAPGCGRCAFDRSSRTVVTGHGPSRTQIRTRVARRLGEHPSRSVRAPATTANIGPGFDCAGAALDLWNELELMPGETSPPTARILASGPSSASFPPSAGTSASSTGFPRHAGSARVPRWWRSGWSRRRSSASWSRRPTSCSHSGSSSKVTATTSLRRSRAASA